MVDEKNSYLFGFWGINHGRILYAIPICPVCTFTLAFNVVESIHSFALLLNRVQKANCDMSTLKADVPEIGGHLHELRRSFTMPFKIRSQQSIDFSMRLYPLLPSTEHTLNLNQSGHSTRFVLK
jgi:hypothetical protein